MKTTKPRWRKSSKSNPNGACVELASWRKSSYSCGGGECAEIGSWRKSSYSGGVGECVEAGHGNAVVGIRDTKQEHLGDQRTVLEFSPAAWREFITQLKE